MTRNKTFIFACGLILVVFLGFLLAGNYRAQLALSQAAFDRLQLELEKRVATLDYFLSERRNDLQTFETRRELSAYFINKDLGVSERYGLKVNLFVIAKLFENTVKEKTVHGLAIYDRILFVDHEGKVLADTRKQPGCPDSKLQDALNTADEKIQIQMVEAGEETQILFSAPFFHKDHFRGMIFAYLSADTILEKIFGAESDPLTSVHIITNDYQACLGNLSVVSLKKLSTKIDSSGRFVSIPKLSSDYGPFPKDMSVIQLPLKNAGFSLLYLAPTEHIFDINQPRQQLLTTAALAVILLLIGGFLIRSSMQLLVLKTRISEEQRQNLKLQQEIDLRAEIENALREKQAQVEEQTTELQESVLRTHQLAYYDTLTGLPNRELCLDRIDQAISAAKRSGKKVILLFLDLDRFKNINDTLGHACGDTLLKLVSERFRACIRAEDSIARLGGDEFVILLSSVVGTSDADPVVQKILDSMIKGFSLDGHETFTTVSIGISIFPDDGNDVFTLLKHADLAMYAAKAKGRNTFSFFSAELNQIASHRREMENNLRKAIDNAEFYLVYQPQFNLQLGKLIGFEALLRWQHPEKGLIPPVTFIPIAEESGLILPIGNWVLACAIKQAKKWVNAGHSDFTVAVNISARQFNQIGIVGEIDTLLQEVGLDPSLLELEVTESIIMDNAQKNIGLLKKLKQRKIKISIDDFGTGYSSLSYLKDFPIDRIKIDQSFIQDIHSHENSVAIVDAIIAMGRSLGLEVLAEGVETWDEAEYLRQRNCEFAQGYYFAHPLSSYDASNLLAETQKDLSRL